MPHTILINDTLADLDGETLARRTGEVVRLRPQAFAILRYLIENANRLVTKTELIRAVWGATAVTDDSLVQGILEIRRALDDGSHSVVTTVTGRGYRLVLPEPLKYTPNRPSLAVLPFVNLDADPAHDRFADGLAGSIISAASRIADLSVIAHSAALDARPRTAANWPATEWNVTRYRLEGSIQGSAGRLRINAQLTEAASAAHVWAQTFDGESGDRFVLQDQFTESIVGALQPSIRRAEIERALRKRLEDLDSWDLYLRAVPPTHANSPEATETALSLLGRSLQLEPKHFAAHAYAAWCHEQRYLRSGFLRADRDAALMHADLALGIESPDAQALAIGAFVRANITRDYDGALGALDRALVIDVNSALVHGFGALICAHGGHHDRALVHAHRSLRLCPYDPLIPTAAGPDSLGIPKRVDF